jgi:hypothetical protein
MSQALTPTNRNGDGIATLVIAKWSVRSTNAAAAGRRGQKQRTNVAGSGRVPTFAQGGKPHFHCISHATIPQCESPLLIRAAREAFRQQIPKTVLRRVAAAPLHELFLATSFSARLFYETVMR